jgi:hypothetical protein
VVGWFVLLRLSATAEGDLPGYQHTVRRILDGCFDCMTVNKIWGWLSVQHTGDCNRDYKHPTQHADDHIFTYVCVEEDDLGLVVNILMGVFRLH